MTQTVIRTYQIDLANLIASMPGLFNFLAATEDIWRPSTACGDSNFTATIATLPGGSTLTYTITGGTNENNIVPLSAAQLGKLVLHNTTRGDDALIDSGTLATNTLVLDSIPGTWQVGDSITCRSQINTRTIAGSYYFDIDLSHADNTVIPSGAVGLKFSIEIIDAGNGNTRCHPFEANSDAKSLTTYGFAAGARDVTIPIVNERFCIMVSASGAATATTLARVIGYFT